MLSGEHPDILVGNLMGDFVKGRLTEGRFPTGILEGLALHRRIDSYAAGSDVFRLSKQRLDDSFGLYRGILVDIFYDHFLAREWESYTKVPLDYFLTTAYNILLEYRPFLPERLQRILPSMFNDWLPSYREVGGIDRALQRMGARIVRPNPLYRGVEALKSNYDGLNRDFCRFFPELIADLALHKLHTS